MALFLFTVLTDGSDIERIQEVAELVDCIIPREERMKLNPYSWFIRFDGTTAELSKELGVASGEEGNAVAVCSSEVSGYGPNEMAKWIEKKTEEDCC